MTQFTDSERNRFWKYVTKLGDDECWPWTGHLNHNGYGILYAQERDMRVHRISYLIHVGEIPTGLWVLHNCDNRKCCNPKHLYTGTAQDNTDDMLTRGRSRHPKGSAHQCAKMDEAQVEHIKRLLADGIPTGEVGELFGLRRSYVYQIASGQKWKHVSPELMSIIKQKVAANYLTPESKAKIRRLFSVDGVAQADLARQFKVSPATICVTVKGLQRGHRVLSYA